MKDIGEYTENESKFQKEAGIMDCFCKKIDESHYNMCREHWDMFIESIRNADTNEKLNELLNTEVPWKIK